MSKPKPKPHSFDAETEAWLQKWAQRDGKTVPDVVAELATERILEDARTPIEQIRRADALYAASKAGPILGIDES